MSRPGGPLRDTKPAARAATAGRTLPAAVLPRNLLAAPDGGLPTLTAHTVQSRRPWGRVLTLPGATANRGADRPTVRRVGAVRPGRSTDAIGQGLPHPAPELLCSRCQEGCSPPLARPLLHWAERASSHRLAEATEIDQRKLHMRGVRLRGPITPSRCRFELKLSIDPDRPLRYNLHARR